MSAVDCWSVSAERLHSNSLARNANSEMLIAQLDLVPPAVILTAKVSFKSTDLASLERPWEWSIVETLLYFGTDLVDKSWCNLFRSSVGATTVCLHGTINAAPTTVKDIANSHNSYFHSAYLRVRYSGSAFEIDNIWLTALSLDSLQHKGPFPKHPG